MSTGTVTDNDPEKEMASST